MEEILGYALFGIGWIALVAGSIWMWHHAEALPEVARTLLNVAIVAFYALGYVCTVYWQGQSWLIGSLPAFMLFIVLLIVAIQAVAGAIRPKKRK